MSSNTIRTPNHTEENRAMAKPSPREIALKFNQAGWGTNPNWRSIWDEVVSPDVIYHFNDNPEAIIGLAENKAFNEALFEGFPDITCTLEDIVAEGEKVVYRTTLKGTHKGEFTGIPATGKVVEVTDFTMVRIKERKIIEWWYTCNLLSVLEQIGVVSQ